MDMNTTCKQCSADFTITDDDLAFYDKVSPVFGDKKETIPPPTRCPDCRLQRRLAHRNEHQLYKRKCALTSKDIVTTYSPDKDVAVFDLAAWWSDDWNPLDEGKDVDFSRPFFDQFRELQAKVPRMAVLQHQNENSLYTNCVTNLKDCYLLFSSDFNQNCYYGLWTERSRDCSDSTNIDGCEKTYEAIFCDHLYNCSFMRAASQCRDSSFLYDCRNCSDCLFCHGLRNKQFCINNEQLTEEEYRKRLTDYRLTSATQLREFKKAFEEMIRGSVHQYMYKTAHVSNSTGDFLSNTENCKNCFEMVESKDCVNCLGFQIQDSRDCTYVHQELGYENCECFPMPFHSAFNVNTYTGNDLYYCDQCMNSCSNCFGCVGLKHKEYCILNKQYTKEEYETLVPKIIEHMRKTGEYGEFFPISHSLYAYNETNAQEEFRLTKEGALQAGYTWRDDDATDHKPATYTLPDTVADTPETVTKEILSCETCNRNYRIIPQEFELCRSLGIAFPRECFECRHAARLAFKNPRKLYERTCMKCQEPITTTFAPDRPETVYCESCYLETVY